MTPASDFPGPIAPARFAGLREARAFAPERVAAALAGRKKRASWRPPDGRLLLIAADHPARGALEVGDNPAAMSDRYELLQRLAIALARPGVDGVLGTADILDDLAFLGLLDGKVVAGSMNRGGLRGAAFEMDDRFTGYTLADIRAKRLDFGKILLRVNLADMATAATLKAVADVVTAATPPAGRPSDTVRVMIEPFLSHWADGRIVHDLTADGVIKSIAITSGLGASSAATWLKIPVVDDMERVMAATTLPTLLLGGDVSANPDDTYARWARALALPGVRGLVVGRQLLYPAGGDVAAAVDRAAALVHP